jgi:hypothetical protein
MKHENFMGRGDFSGSVGMGKQTKFYIRPNENQKGRKAQRQRVFVSPRFLAIPQFLVHCKNMWGRPQPLSQTARKRGIWRKWELTTPSPRGDINKSVKIHWTLNFFSPEPAC